MLSACFSVSLPVNFSVMLRNSFFDGSVAGPAPVGAAQAGAPQVSTAGGCP